MIEYLRRQGYSIPRISRELGISRITVKRYLENPQKGKYCRLEPYISKLDSYKEYIKSRLKDYSEIKRNYEVFYLLKTEEILVIL